MTRKPSQRRADTPQLGLPFVQQGPAHDLAHYIGICTVFASYHKRWPTKASTREAFRAARILGYDGRRIDRELRYPGRELEADPAYQALRDRCRAEGKADGVDLAMLDPRCRSVLQDEAIEDVLDSLALPGQAAPGTVRYATGMAAHAPGELTLDCGEAIRTRAAQAARLDPLDPAVLRLLFTVRVRANDALKAFIDRTGMTYRAADGPLADHYRLEADDDGLLHIRYRLLAGGRYAGRFDVGRLTARLAAALAARPDLAREKGQPDEAPPPAVFRPDGTDGDDELRRQLRMLTPEGASLKLPIQALSRLPDIRRAVEQAGGVYRPRRQQFDFAGDIAAADVLARLLALAS
jgi:hypothetical protein